MNPTSVGPKPALTTQPWSFIEGQGPLVATAIHNGHDVRPDLAARLAIDKADRRREEDPFTGGMTEVAPTQVVVYRSRFEIDLNRPRDRAVYLRPEDAWGLRVWREAPGDSELAASLELYDRFYRELEQLIERLVRRFGNVLVLDLHSYNHRRGGPAAPADDPQQNPEVNVGTGSMDREYWAPVVDRLIHGLRQADFLGRRLDVRENVRFQGGYLSGWLHERFPQAVCAPAIEWKKFFMDEWTGQPDARQLRAIIGVLRSAAESLLEELHQR